MTEWKVWIKEVENVIKRHYEVKDDWLNWDDWRSYYLDGFRPHEAVREAHRTS